MAFPTEAGVPSQPPAALASPNSTIRSRAQSVSSDRPSTVGHNLMSPPLAVSPEAAFIAASAASQIVTNDHDSHAGTWLDMHGIEPSADTALVSPAALQLVNNFLDQLLFNFLAVSRSTSIAALRPAVSEVLKPKLAKDAIQQADEELREYLGGGDDALLDEPGEDDPRDWDGELVWKRTRLRCMVYSSLGDMEEEDEDFHMEQENLGWGDDAAHGATVSPAVAIFLTSILEFMGEQALVVAGQAAFHRMRAKYDKEVKEGARSPSAEADRIVVDELDMERVALDRTLGRLWRAWKKKIRTPGTMDQNLARAFSRDSVRLDHRRQASAAMSAEAAARSREPVPDKQATPEPEPGAAPEVREATVKGIEPADVPLPMGEDDIAEILVPGLARYEDDDDDDDEVADGGLKVHTQRSLRPRSLMISPSSTIADLPTPTMSQPNTPVVTSRKRRNSLPTPAASPYTSSPKRNIVEAALGDVSSEDTDDGERGRAEDSSLEDDSSMAAEADSDVSDERIEKEEQERKPKRKAVRLSIMVGGASAVGARATAIAGVGSMEKPTSVPKSAAAGPEAEADTTDAIEDFSEEAEILTSSRVPLSGRSSPPSASEHGGPSPPLSTKPSALALARSPSVHSLRLIEVQSPRSPMSRSRGGSVDAAGAHLRSKSSTPSIAEEQRQAGDYVSSARSVSHPIPKSHRHQTSESICEADELPERRPEKPMAIAVVADAVQGSSQPPVQAIFGSVPRLRSPHRSPVLAQPAPSGLPPAAQSHQAPTKVALVKNALTASGSTVFLDDKPEAPSSPRSSRAHRQASVPSPWPAPAPAVPERSPSRQPSVQPKPQQVPAATHYTQAASTSISGRRPSAPSSPQSIHEELGTFAEPMPPHSRQLHTSGSSTSSSLKYKAVRASEENNSMRPEDLARNFEELIQSDETIQYTLTPESMRDIDVRAIPPPPPKSPNG